MRSGKITTISARYPELNRMKELVLQQKANLTKAKCLETTRYAEAAMIATQVFDFCNRSIMFQLQAEELSLLHMHNTQLSEKEIKSELTQYHACVKTLADEMRLYLCESVWILTNIYTKSHQYDLVWKYFKKCLNEFLIQAQIKEWCVRNIQNIGEFFTRVLQAYVTLNKDKCDSDILNSIYEKAYEILKNFPTVIPHFQSQFSDVLIQAGLHEKNSAFLKAALLHAVNNSYTRDAIQKMKVNAAVSETAVKAQKDECRALVLRAQQWKALGPNPVIPIKNAPHMSQMCFLIMMAGRPLPVAMLNFLADVYRAGAGMKPRKKRYNTQSQRLFVLAKSGDLGVIAGKPESDYAETQVVSKR